jgi:NitT/TauT family transport system permease protein
MKRFKAKISGNFLSVLVLLTFATTWEVVSRLGIFHPFFMPPLSLILLKLVEMFIDGEIFPHIVSSLIRIALGFFAALVLAIPIGVILGWSKRIYKIFELTIEILRPVPPISLIAIAMLWLGIGEAPKIFIIGFACFFPILINTIYGVRGVDDHLIKSAKMLGANESQILYKVVIPSALPYIFAGIRVSLAIAFMTLIAAEMVAANSGLGFLIIFSEQTFQIKEMYATLITILLLGAISAMILIRIENHYTRWHKEITLQKAK